MNSSETSTPVPHDENNITKSGKLQLGERLDSWKEIALYLKRSVRCVQRWEKNEGMPIRRHSHANGMSVYAFCDELHAWLQTRQFRSIEIPSPGISNAASQKTHPQSDHTEQKTPRSIAVGRQEPASGCDSIASTLKARGLTAIVFVLRRLTGRIGAARFARIADVRSEREQTLSGRL
jgi:hypothetical protein